MLFSAIVIGQVFVLCLGTSTWIEQKRERVKYTDNQLI